MSSSRDDSLWENYAPRTVRIVAYNQDWQIIGFGSGFLVSPKGHILTCTHVIRDALGETCPFLPNRNGRVKHFLSDEHRVFFQYDEHFDSKENAHIAVLLESVGEDVGDLSVLQKVRNEGGRLIAEDAEEYFSILCDFNLAREQHVEGFAFPEAGPNASTLGTRLVVESLVNEGRQIKLDEANNIGRGCSGGALLYHEMAVGVIHAIDEPRTGNRLSETAYAISAKRIFELFPDMKKEFSVVSEGISAPAPGFPDCAVWHTGRIRYLPALLDLTPCSYTYFVASHSSHGIAFSLKNCMKRRNNWVEYSFIQFLEISIAEIPEKLSGIIINLPSAQIETILSILRKRKKVACAIPFLINVFFDGQTKLEENCLEQVKEYISNWMSSLELVPLPENKDYVERYIEDFFLVQREEKSETAPSHTLQYFQRMERHERWQILLSDREYFDMAIQQYMNADAQGLSWLLLQMSLGFEAANATERQDLCSDSVLIQDWDRESIRFPDSP